MTCLCCCLLTLLLGVSQTVSHCTYNRATTMKNSDSDSVHRVPLCHLHRDLYTSTANALMYSCCFSFSQVAILSLFHKNGLLLPSKPVLNVLFENFITCSFCALSDMYISPLCAAQTTTFAVVMRRECNYVINGNDAYSPLYFMFHILCEHVGREGSFEDAATKKNPHDVKCVGLNLTVFHSAVVPLLFCILSQVLIGSFSFYWVSPVD